VLGVGGCFVGGGVLCCRGCCFDGFCFLFLFVIELSEPYLDEGGGVEDRETHRFRIRTDPRGERRAVAALDESPY